MNRLNFYRQKRSDGGLRSGVDFNDERVLETYQPGKLPQDSALLWFIDIRCSGKNLPSDPEEIRHWFLDRKASIQSALKKLAADLLPAGVDSGWPIRRVIPSKDNVKMAVYCSAIRRLTGREISQVLSGLANEWPDLIERLGTYEHTASAHA